MDYVVPSDVVITHKRHRGVVHSTLPGADGGPPVDMTSPPVFGVGKVRVTGWSLLISTSDVSSKGSDGKGLFRGRQLV